MEFPFYSILTYWHQKMPVYQNYKLFSPNLYRFFTQQFMSSLFKGCVLLTGDKIELQLGRYFRCALKGQF